MTFNFHHNFGILADIVGAGKTFAILGMILNRKVYENNNENV